MLNSPYSPGAGHAPPVLAGREVLTAAWTEMLSDLQTSGRLRAADMILTGPRGTGKTATLSKFHDLATEQHYDIIVLQAVKGRGSLIDGLMARANDRIIANSTPWAKAKQTLERIGGITLGLAGASAAINLNPLHPRPLPDASLFAQGLAELANAIRDHHEAGGILVTVDELQVTDPDDLALLAATLHRLNVEHRNAPVAFAATGLPNTIDALNAAGVTHPHRLFDEQPIGLQLTEHATRYAISKPALDRKVKWDDDALIAAVHASNQYPAHIQEIAHATWLHAEGPRRITQSDVEGGIEAATARIQRRELEPRWNDTTDRQAELLAAIATIGHPAASRQINAALDRKQSEWSTLRAELIASGDLYPVRRGNLAFATPTYLEYVLENYAERRATASIHLLSTSQIESNLAKALREQPRD